MLLVVVVMVVVAVVGVGLRMRVGVMVVSVRMVVVVVRMLVYRHGPGMRLKIASRVIIQPDQAVTGDINIGHGSLFTGEREVVIVAEDDIKKRWRIKDKQHEKVTTVNSIHTKLKRGGKRNDAKGNNQIK